MSVGKPSGHKTGRLPAWWAYEAKFWNIEDFALRGTCLDVILMIEKSMGGVTR